MKNEKKVCNGCGKEIIEAKGGFTKAIITDKETKKVTGIQYMCYHCSLIEVLNAVKVEATQGASREHLKLVVIELNQKMAGAKLTPNSYEKTLAAFETIEKDKKIQKVVIAYCNECLVLVKKNRKK